MSRTAPASPAERALAALMVGGAWACYLPLGVKYATVVAGAIAASCVLRQRNPVPGAGSELHQAPALAATLALLSWLAATAIWSPASGSTMSTHLAQYGLLLVAPILAAACPPTIARRALQHFVGASVLVAALFVLARLGWLPAASGIWHSTVEAEGNQRIATSILLALGSCLALWLALPSRSWIRWIWLLGAAMCLLGLSLQDRRTGMVVLPIVLLAWSMARQPGWRRRIVMALCIALAAVLAWSASDGVRTRFAEGLAELRDYPADDNVATSWGQRLRLWQLTETMVEERPLLGHGLGSWQGMWRDRVAPGSAVAEHTTPHNTYLLLAQQGGVVALFLWLWVLLTWLRHALRAASAGSAALVVWTAIACVGLFNASLRDAKFALPLLLLAGLASALTREPVRPNGKPREEPARSG